MPHKTKSLSVHRAVCSTLCILFFTCTHITPCHAQKKIAALTKALSDYMVCFRLELIGLEKQELAVSSKTFCLTEVYPENDLRPYWVTPNGPGERAKIVFDFLKRAELEGLDPANYEVELISEIFKENNPAALAMLDALLTFNLIKYIHDVSSGQIKQVYGEPSQLPLAENIMFNPRATMIKVMVAEDLAAYLANLPPQHRHYQGLKKALAQYREIEKKGGWPEIPDGPTMEPGDNDTRVPILMRRLYVTGDLDLTQPLAPLTTTYGPVLEQGVMKFQQRHGLEPDGIIGADTVSALNVSVQSRIKQIIINMTRWRWQEHDLGERYLLVNIAHFDLTAFEADHYALGMRVIVGKFLNQTPVFSDRVTSVEINPYWNIPKSIARDEELPELKKDSEYLVKRNVRMLSGWKDNETEIDSKTIDWSTFTPEMMDTYHLRQDPGPWNALGRIKFLFPNTYSVYLHDTPTQSLFSRPKRAFSHGCIRVSEPERLAEFILSGQKDKKWNPELIKKTIEKKEHVVIGLVEELPVHITYQTAWFDKSQIVCFNYDVYGRDEKLLEAIFEE